MSLSLGDAILHLKADRSQLQSDLEGAGTDISGWIGGLQGALTTGMVGLLVGSVMKGIQAAGEEQTALMKLEAVYRATGGAVGWTVDQLKELAAQLMQVTGIEDDQFFQAEALAMTYDNISGQVLPRLLTVAADMAALFDGDVVSSTRNVAMALSAGEEGLTRLRRAGVLFTDEQKEMVASMMESGDVMGAQDLILTELESRFGGTAAAALDTYNGRLQALKTSVGELWEALGNLNIGGRTLIDWMTDGIATATSLLNIHAEIDNAYASTRDEIAASATTYIDYAESVSGVAVAAGKLTERQRDLWLRMVNGRAITEQERWSWWSLHDALEEVGIEADELDWVQQHLVETTEETIPVIHGQTVAVDELGNAARTTGRSFGDIAEAARHAFGQVDTSLAGTIENFRTQMAWIAGGGLELQTAADQIMAALQRGAITQEEADALFQPVEAAALGLQADIGQITMDDATRTMASDWGGDWEGARSQIQGARQDILTIPAEVRSQILVAVRYQIYGEGGVPGGKGGQHGLSFDVEGPSGSDQVPVNLALTRGEHVEVTPEGEQGKAGGRTLHIGQVVINSGLDQQAFNKMAENWLRA